MLYNIFCLSLGLILMSQITNLIHNGKLIKGYKKMISIIFQKVLSFVDYDGFKQLVRYSQ